MCDARPISVWDPELVVGAELARELIGTQFPSLGDMPLELLGEGWDNTVWLAGGVAFRFPRRAVAVPGVRHEIAVLPSLARRVPIAIPDAAYVGAPARGYPWPWFGHRLINGNELASARLDIQARIALGPPLGRFLRSLHALALPVRLPIDPNRRADMAVRVPMAREALAALAPRWTAPAAALELLDEAEELAAPERVVLVHGDLHVRHVLVGPGGWLAGVIDWGDVCRADPGVDLSLLWSVLPPSGRSGFLDAYGPVGEGSLLRARVLALFLNATLARYARAKDMADLEREALEGLGRALEG